MMKLDKADAKERLECVGITLESLEVFMVDVPDFEKSVALLRDAQRSIAGAIRALDVQSADEGAKR